MVPEIRKVCPQVNPSQMRRVSMTTLWAATTRHCHPVRTVETKLLRVRTQWTDKINLFGSSKILDNLSSVGALRNSKIFFNHKFQSHGNKHRRLLAVNAFAGKFTWDLRSHGLTVIFNRFDRICCLGILLLVIQFFPSLNLFNSSRSSCYFHYASGGFTLFNCNVLVLEILAGFGLKYSD